MILSLNAPKSDLCKVYFYILVFAGTNQDIAVTDSLLTRWQVFYWLAKPF